MVRRIGKLVTDETGKEFVVIETRTPTEKKLTIISDPKEVEHAKRIERGELTKREFGMLARAKMFGHVQKAERESG